jgi:DNA repair protein RecN (Recombination protein N)
VLSLLRVQSFILMDALELKLEPGFNVITGETGAGKSIIVGALGLVLGGRASAEMVRPGAEEAEVEALFEMRGDDRLAAILDAAGIPNGRDGELVVRRIVQSSGRSRAYLNGRLCTAAELARLAPHLCDVASQHESVALTDPATHLGYLDRFARLSGERDELSVDVERLEETAARLAAARLAERERGEREAFVAFQLQSIDALAPRPGEMEELALERNRLRHAGRLLDVTRRAADRLEHGDETVCDELARLASDLEKAAELDPALAAAAQAVESARTELSEVGRDLARYAERTGVDPSRLAEVEDRMYRLEGLMRQHGATLDDVLAARQRLADELERFATAGTTIATLEQQRVTQLAAAAERARRLSKKRRQAAEKLGKAISAELGELAMGGARVIVDVAPLSGDRAELAVDIRGDGRAVDVARLGRDGIDRVEFLISPNKGIDPRPLRRIASGGELSRSLLALKRVLAGSGPAGLYVFDEVDAGVGGAVADKIGRAIADVAQHHQVLCITHLAPIAAFADAHFVVQKHGDAKVARSAIVRARDKDRLQEVARMLAGAKVTPAAVKAASELIRAARG